MTITSHSGPVSRNRRGIFIGCTCLSLVAVALAGFGLSLSITALVVIEPEARGVVISPYEPTGYRAELLQPGWHWLRPGERVIHYLLAQQTYTMSATSGSSPDAIEAPTNDKQTVSVDVVVVYAIDPEQIVDLHITWQDRYPAEVVRPLTRSVVREIIAHYNADEVSSTKRVEVQEAIFEQLQAELVKNHLVLVDLQLPTVRRAE